VALGSQIIVRQIPSSSHSLRPANLIYHTSGSINGKRYFFTFWSLLLDIEKNALVIVYLGLGWWCHELLEGGRKKMRKKLVEGCR